MIRVVIVCDDFSHKLDINRSQIIQTNSN